MVSGSWETLTLKAPQPYCQLKLLIFGIYRSRDPFNRPAETGYFPHDSRHFVPGYYQPVPSGTKDILPAEALIKLALMG